MGRTSKVQSEIRECVRPSLCLKALGSPSVPHPAAKLRIQRRVVSSCHIDGLPHLFSVGNTSPRKHFTSHCFVSAVEGRSKPAFHLRAFYLPSVLEGRFFFHVSEEAVANVSEMGLLLFRLFLSFIKSKVSLWGKRIREAAVMCPDFFKVCLYLLSERCQLSFASMQCLQNTWNFEVKWVDLTFGYFWLGERFSLNESSCCLLQKPDCLPICV